MTRCWRRLYHTTPHHTYAHKINTPAHVRTHTHRKQETRHRDTLGQATRLKNSKDVQMWYSAYLGLLNSAFSMDMLACEGLRKHRAFRCIMGSWVASMVSTRYTATHTPHEKNGHAWPSQRRGFGIYLSMRNQRPQALLRRHLLSPEFGTWSTPGQQCTSGHVTKAAGTRKRRTWHHNHANTRPTVTRHTTTPTTHTRPKHTHHRTVSGSRSNTFMPVAAVERTMRST